MTENSPKSDRTLVESTLAGDAAAFEELVRRHWPAVFRCAYRLTGNRFTAEDAAQDAFVCAWTDLHALRDPRKFREYVCAIARRRAIDQLRRSRAAIPALSLDEEPLPELSAGEEEATELRRAVRELSGPLRQTVWLHYFQGYSVKEIAGKLGIPEGTVKWRLSKGRKELRRGYGIMEETKFVDDAVFDRIFRQVRQMRRRYRWGGAMREETQEEMALLRAQLDEMEQSEKKEFLKADFLAMEGWWGRGGDADLPAKLKEAAVRGRNEEVLTDLLGDELLACRKDDEAEALLRDRWIPFLKDGGFETALGEAYWKWSRLCRWKKDFAKAREMLTKAREVLPKDSLLYGAATAELDCLTAPPPEPEGGVAREFSPPFPIFSGPAGGILFGDAEEYRKCGENWLFWGNCHGMMNLYGENLFHRSLSPAEGELAGSLSLGESRRFSSGRAVFTLTCLPETTTVATPAGRFSGCREYLLQREFPEGSERVRTFVCPEVGIVRQSVESFLPEELNVGWTGVWELKAFYPAEGSAGKGKAGAAFFPLTQGTRWEYSTPREAVRGVRFRFENIYTVGYGDGERAIVLHRFTALPLGPDDSFEGLRRRLAAASANSFSPAAAAAIGRALKAKAEKGWQKLYAAMAGEAVRQIADAKESGRPGNAVFETWGVLQTGEGSRPCHSVYERIGAEGRRPPSMLSLLSEGSGDFCFDSRGWVSGYREGPVAASGYDREFVRSLEVLPAETVETPAGVFQGCRRMRIRLRSRREGAPALPDAPPSVEMEVWNAPGIGIVRFQTKGLGEGKSSLWQLTAFRGSGRAEEFFPWEEGFVRRYGGGAASGGSPAGRQGESLYVCAREEGALRLLFHLVAEKLPEEL